MDREYEIEQEHDGYRRLEHAESAGSMGVHTNGIKISERHFKHGRT